MSEIIDNEKEYDNEGYPVKVSFAELRPDDMSGRHEHFVGNAFEFYIVNNGTMQVYGEDVTKSITAGEGVAMTPGTKYRCIPLGGVCAFYFLKVRPDFILGTDEYFVKNYLRPMELSKIKLLFLAEDDLRDEQIIDIGNRVIAVNMAKKPGYELLTKGYLCSMYALICEYIRNAEKRRNNPYSMMSQDALRIRAASQYIAANYSFGITLDEIADNIHISRGECCRCFQRTIGMSPFEYLMEFRIFQAIKILFKSPDELSSISELAMNVGFNNASYFNKVFKKYVQCTPSQYLQMIRLDPDGADSIYAKLQTDIQGSV